MHCPGPIPRNISDGEMNYRVSPAAPRLAILISALVLGLISHDAAADPQMAFRSLGIDDGLSQSTVNDSLQDSRGFMWLATESGLNRYDGRAFRTYRRNPGDPNALESDFIWSLAEDARGDLWLATDGAGLVHWDRQHDRFRTVTELRGAPARGQARVVVIDRQQRIWVGTRGAGLMQFDGAGREVSQFRHRSDDPASLASDSVFSLLEDEHGQLLVGSETGVQQLDPATGMLTRIADESAGLLRAAVSSLMLDRDGALWVGTFENGLLVRGSGQTRFRRFAHSDAEPASLGSNQVRALLQDSVGRIWVATQSGLNLFQPQTATFSVFRHADANRYSLSDDLLMSLSQDREGVLWIGTRLGGANRWNPRSWSLGGQAPQPLAGAVVLAFADGGDGSTWAGGFGAPLIKFDQQGKTLQTFAPADGYPDRGEAPVTALLRTRDERLWIGTMGDGLQIHRPGAGKLLSLRHDPHDPASLRADGIMSLLEGRDGDVWVGTFGGGISRVTPAPLAVRNYPAGAGAYGDLASSRVVCLAQDPSGMIWAGTDGHGLLRLDPATGEIRQFRHDPKRPASLGTDSIYSLHAAADGDLWVGTAGAGLAQLTAAQASQPDPQFRHFTTSDGLSSNVINGIQPDRSGRLWLSTNSGLVRFEPLTSASSVFHRAHGAQSEEFNAGAHFRNPDGRLFFGGTGGFNGFDPDAVEIGMNPPPVVLTGFEKFNAPVATGAPVEDLRSLELKHDDDVITFEYAALDFTAPERNLYSVMLQGFDRDWSPPSPRNRTTYTNLDAGSYVFRIRAANSDGVWTPDPVEINMTVRAAPWATPLAYATYVAVIALAAFVFFRWRLRELEREARVRQLAYYDRITGLPNRDLFELRLDAAIAQTRSTGESIGVVCLRVAPSRWVHAGGRSLDDVLRGVTQRLSQSFFNNVGNNTKRELARLRDDVFMVFVQDADAETQASYWAKRLCAAVSAPMGIGDHQITVPAFAGIAMFPAQSESAASLIKFADTAANDRESDRSAGFAYYDKAMTERAQDRLALESELRRAIKDNALELHLQGKFTADGRLVGAEALTRWTHPQRGPVSPGVFVPLAEESDLIVELDEWVVGEACRILHAWQQRAYPALSIAVNISAATFATGRIFQALENNRRRFDTSAAGLEIEITESVLATDLEQITATLGRIKALGHTLSLDDFGTGYSSLTYLQRFPIDNLKVDQAFIKGVERSPDQVALCTAIISLARSLGMGTIGEGVENQAQLDLLRGLGCGLMQGYFLHRPESVGMFEQRFLVQQAPATGAAVR